MPLLPSPTWESRVDRKRSPPQAHFTAQVYWKQAARLLPSPEPGSFSHTFSQMDASPNARQRFKLLRTGSHRLT